MKSFRTVYIYEYNDICGIFGHFHSGAIFITCTGNRSSRVYEKTLEKKTGEVLETWVRWLLDER